MGELVAFAAVSEHVYAQLFDALAADDGPAEDVADCILAAADGADALASHLAGASVDRREAAPPPDPADPPRAYLKEIAVTNFRGIADRARLQLQPGPGLTVVAGRNGSGKSSFAEGLELLLTGHNLRWENKPAVWTDGWRNLHGAGATKLEAVFVVDGEADPLRVTRDWSAGTKLADAQEPGVTGPRDDWRSLGWEAALQRYRPLLSYSELGTMFSDRAKELYDALSSILGLEEFDAVQATLRDARLRLGDSAKSERAARDRLKVQLEPVEDDRAAVSKQQLAKTKPDRDAVAQALVDPPQDTDLAPLRGITGLRFPDESEIAAVLEAADAAAARLAELEATDADRDHRLGDLLTAALDFHDRHGSDSTCPVCGTGDVLDESWSLRTQAEVEALKSRSSELRAAHRAHDAARQRVEGLFDGRIPATLRGADLDAEPALAAWDAWTEQRGDADRCLALTAALTDVTARARAELDARDAAFRPIHTAITEWLGLAAKAAADKITAKLLTDGEAWLKAHIDDLRAARFEPVIDAARANWEHLRHESNVELSDIQLRKTGVQRRAEFDVTVDGSGASAFGVMSQGELSALAISIFLPRASLPESPFGFLVIDDPVQSMDPAKVDGLARVLEQAAKTRQVIVFTHDARLPEALHRLSIPARVVDVKRRAQSKVEVVAGARPSERHLQDAFSLCMTEDLPDDARDRVIPVFCRSAIEAACGDAIRRRAYEQGEPHAAVEQRLAGLTTLNSWLAAAYGLPQAKGAELRQRVVAHAGPQAWTLVQRIKSGAHDGAAGDLLEETRGAERLVRKIETL